jgi:hypothetical protein
MIACESKVFFLSFVRTKPILDLCRRKKKLHCPRAGLPIPGSGSAGSARSPSDLASRLTWPIRGFSAPGARARLWVCGSTVMVVLWPGRPAHPMLWTKRRCTSFRSCQIRYVADFNFIARAASVQQIEWPFETFFGTATDNNFYIVLERAQ